MPTTSTHSIFGGLRVYIFISILMVNIIITGFLVYALFYYAIIRPLPNYIAVPDNYLYNQDATDDNYFIKNAIDSPPFPMVTLDQP